MNFVESQVLVTFVLAWVVLNAVPGPGMMFMTAHGMVGGRRAGLAAQARDGLDVLTTLMKTGLT